MSGGDLLLYSNCSDTFHLNQVLDHLKPRRELSSMRSAATLLTHRAATAAACVLQGSKQQPAAAAADPLLYGITPELGQFVRSLTYSTFRWGAAKLQHCSSACHKACSFIYCACRTPQLISALMLARCHVCCHTCYV
jgi:hypothetical protein